MWKSFRIFINTKISKKKLYKTFRIFFIFWFLLSNFLFGFPIEFFLENAKIVRTAHALTATYDFATCGSTCDTDSTWWASADQVDIYRFAGSTANRNTHTELDDTGYGNLATSDNSYYSPSAPPTGDEILMWFEMPISEEPNSILELEFTYEGYPSGTTTNFSIWVKTAAGAYEEDASWVQVGTTTSITSNTDTTISGTITENIPDYIDVNGNVVWAVYEAASALVINTDYVKLDVVYLPVDQEGYRWRNDDGSETTATWIDSQDTNITQPIETNTRLRLLLDAIGTGDPDSNQYLLEYKRSTDSTYLPVGGTPTDVTPTIESWSSGASTAVNASSHAITMPSGITAGDLLLIVFSTDGTADVAITAGDWVELSQAQANGVSSGIFYKFATGSDTATVATGSEQTSHIVYRISGASAPYIAQTTGDSTNTDPPNLDTGTSRNYLWIATATHDSTVVASGAPANYSNLHTQAAAGTDGASTSTAERSTTASSENPGTFTSNTEQWISSTIAIPSSSMGIYATRAVATGTTSLTMTYPSDIDVGDLLILGIANKHPTAAPSTPTGWTAASNNQGSGGSGSDALDTGSMYSTVFYKIADGTEQGQFTVTITSGNAAAGRIITYRPESGKEWSIAMANGSDNAGGTSWSVTAGADPGITAGDMVLAVSASNTDASAYSAQNISATGVTFDSAEKEVSENNTNAGNDLELIFSNHYAISGTSSAAPVYTMTSSSGGTDAPAGATVLVRIRQVTAPIMLATSSNISSGGEATTAQLTAPSEKSTSDFLAGRIQDDENPPDAIDLSSTQYTELEWNLTATSNAVNDEVYQFRVTVGGLPLSDYLVTPQWTIGTAGGGTPTFTQSSYRFYVDSDNENVTDPWGNPNIAEDTLLALLPATNVAPKDSDEMRLRVAITVGDATLNSSSQQFKLQYKAGTDASCTTGSWTDVGAGGGVSIWRYATSGVTDGTTLTVAKLTTSDVLGVYAKASPTATNPNSATVGQALEYDFHMQHNGAATASTYSFRVVESDGTQLSSYTYCPTLTTAQATSQELRHGNVFSEEVEKGFTRAD